MSVTVRKRIMIDVIILATVILLVLLATKWMSMMPGESHQGALPALTQSQQYIAKRLKRIVEHLSVKIGPRNMGRYAALTQAADFIEHEFRALGYTPRSQEYTLQGQTLRNIEVQIPGSDEMIVVGAHYDTVPGSPGADDNASGVAGVIELARLLKDHKPTKTIRLVAFVNEEPPYFMTKNMGSYHYAKRAKDNNDNIIAMFSIESIGYYNENKGSQKYPIPFSLFYPNKGNFIAFVANLSSRSLVKKSLALFREHQAFPSEGVSAPGWVMGVNWSDQYHFWKMGYPGVMITDTALFRNPNYHTDYDMPSTLDFNKTARVVEGIQHMLIHLST